MRKELSWQETVASFASLPVMFGLLALHEDWLGGMVPQLVVWFVAAFLVSILFSPLHVLLHELGHGLIALALTRRRVEIEVGSVENPLTISVGRLELRVCLWQATGGVCRFDPSSGLRIALIALGGPLASGALAVALGATTIPMLEDHPFAYLVLGIATVDAFMGFLNLVPSSGLSAVLPGAPLAPHATDGLLIWRSLFGTRGKPLTLVERLSAASHSVLALAHRLADGGEVGTRHILHSLAAHGVVSGLGHDDVALGGDEPAGADARLIERVQHTAGETIEPVDLLRGILDDPTCAASQQLASLGVDRRALRLGLEQAAAA